jgi:hypothetical protein
MNDFFLNLKAGDRVFATSSILVNRRELRCLTVSKVGRQYFYCRDLGRDLKFERATGAHVTDWGKFQLWESEEQYLADRSRRDLALVIIKKLDPYRQPLRFTLEQVTAIAEILGMEVGDA